MATNDRLDERPIEAGSQEFDSFLKLYESSFPEEERTDHEFLLKGALLDICSFTAYYDGDLFCGFTYEISLEHSLYVLFIAVNSEVRSRGYGSRILSQVKEHASGRPIVLDIEPLADDAPNAEQRARRLRYYERNGFARTGYSFIEDGMRFSALSTDGYCNMEEMAQDIAKACLPGVEFKYVREV